MAIQAYISSFDDVRALLGVSDEELEDATIALKVYERLLESDLIEIDPSLIGDFVAVNAEPTESRTSAQRAFLSAMQVFSTFCVANHLATALPQFSPRLITDSKATMQRHSEKAYEVTLAGIQKGLAVASARLRKAHATLADRSVVEITVFSGLALSSPTSDPVTGT